MMQQFLKFLMIFGNVDPNLKISTDNKFDTDFADSSDAVLNANS